MRLILALGVMIVDMPDGISQDHVKIVLSAPTNERVKDSEELPHRHNGAPNGGNGDIPQGLYASVTVAGSVAPASSSRQPTAD